MPRGGQRLRTSDGRVNQVGDKVRARRATMGITQDGLCARLAAVTDGEWVADRKDIGRIEGGQRIVGDLELFALAAALECDAGWILGDAADANLPWIAGGRQDGS